MTPNEQLHADLSEIIENMPQVWLQYNLAPPFNNSYIDTDYSRPYDIDGAYLLMLVDDEGPLVLKLWSILICDDGSLLLFGKALAGHTNSKIGDTVIYTVNKSKNNVVMYELVKP